MDKRTAPRRRVKEATMFWRWPGKARFIRFLLECDHLIEKPGMWLGQKHVRCPACARGERLQRLGYAAPPIA